MAHTIPAGPVASGGLRDVLTSCLDAVLGRPNALRLPPMRHAAVVLVDGLGAQALAARAGHARTLAGASGRRARMVSGFPTTTAAALASLTTGAEPGRHGLVGYSALDPRTGAVVNLLHGFDDGSIPDSWQRCGTVFERAAAEGVRAVAIGPRHYATTGFTRAVLRGAEYLGARSIATRFETWQQVAATAGPSIGYLYVPELDMTAHAEGWQSPRWTEHLEAVDAAVAECVAGLPADVGLLLTADHGILDTSPDRHLFFDAVPGLLDDVVAVAGEPRCRQLHLRSGADAAATAQRWNRAFGGAVRAVTRDEAVGEGWFGVVDAPVAPRIGDVLVAATGRWVLLDSRRPKGHGMIGQHGSWTDAERIVPLLRFGAARETDRRIPPTEPPAGTGPSS